jgi:hypothetical protein
LGNGVRRSLAAHRGVRAPGAHRAQRMLRRRPGIYNIAVCSRACIQLCEPERISFWAYSSLSTRVPGFWRSLMHTFEAGRWPPTRFPS